MRIRIVANNGSEIYDGNVEDMPGYGFFVDIYEEAVNMGIEKGENNGWKWEVA